MAKRVPKPCKKPNCGKLSSEKHGYCEEHSALVWGMKSRKTAERGYGSSWQKVRIQALKKSPFCTFPGCKKWSEEVDHIDGDTFNNQPDNLRPYCKQHHALKTKLVDNPSTKVMSFERWETKFKNK